VAFDDRPVPDGYIRIGTQLYHKSSSAAKRALQLQESRQRAAWDRMVAASPSQDLPSWEKYHAQITEILALRRRVYELEKRLAKLDMCITPDCGNKIAILRYRLCGSCYNRFYRAGTIKNARVMSAAEREAAEEAAAGAREDAYQVFVLETILAELARLDEYDAEGRTRRPDRDRERCPYGHRYDESNSGKGKGGYPSCLTCGRTAKCTNPGCKRVAHDHVNTPWPAGFAAGR
jgi:hypothetical protein